VQPRQRLGQWAVADTSQQSESFRRTGTGEPMGERAGRRTRLVLQSRVVWSVGSLYVTVTWRDSTHKIGFTWPRPLRFDYPQEIQSVGHLTTHRNSRTSSLVPASSVARQTGHLLPMHAVCRWWSASSRFVKIRLSSHHLQDCGLLVRLVHTRRAVLLRQNITITTPFTHTHTALPSHSPARPFNKCTDSTLS
jgi:hypothetical protein